jgi:hypothetical protein
VEICVSSDVVVVSAIACVEFQRYPGPVPWNGAAHDGLRRERGGEVGDCGLAVEQGRGAVDGHGVQCERGYGGLQPRHHVSVAAMLIQLPPNPGTSGCTLFPPLHCSGRIIR